MPRELIALVIVACTLGLSCSNQTNSNKDSPHGIEEHIVYAKGFTLTRFNNYTKIKVYNPWQQAKKVNLEYYLVNRNDSVPAELKEKEIIRTPISKIICMSTTHLGFLSALDEVSSIQAISGTKYASNPEIIKRINNNEIKEIGYEQALNYELILKLKPDLIMVYGVNGEVTGTINKLKELGIQVVLNGEYLEETPLAKAEWIKFMGSFFNKQQKATSYFNTIEQNYKAICKAVESVKKKPFVLTGLPYKDTWWMSGGNSNLATLIRDAGANYLWKENQSRESFAVALEEVAIRSLTADYWINSGTANTLSDILAADSRIATFPPVKKRTIFNNNLISSAEGGNDYWERGVVRPDLILADLVKIFHPELANDTIYNFYKPLR